MQQSIDQEEKPIQQSIDQEEKPIQQSIDQETKQIKVDNNNQPTDEVKSSESKSKQDIFIKYHIEKENVNIDPKNILEEIDVNLQKENQNLEKSNTVDDLSSTLKNSQSNEKQVDNVIQEEEEEIEIPLTPEMEHANTFYHQAMKLINGTINRQYET